MSGPRRWSLAVTAMSLSSATVASACCVGPLVLALLGIGGAGALAKLEPYRPYFVVATVAFLGGGFYLAYRRPKTPTAPVAGEQDCACPTPRARRAGKVALWIATVLVVGILSAPHSFPSVFASPSDDAR